MGSARLQSLALAVGLSEACWGAGRSLTDPAVREDVVTRTGLDARDLASRIARPEVKAALRSSTERALKRGVFGVPTFAFGEELFWGHDRLDELSRRLDGAPPEPSAELVARMIARPSGADRKRGASSPGKADELNTPAREGNVMMAKLSPRPGVKGSIRVTIRGPASWAPPGPMIWT